MASVCRKKNSRLYLTSFTGEMNPETKKEGNGLGLYIVKYLMEAMGGSVRAEKCGRISGVSGTAHFSGEEKLKMADNKKEF